MNSSYIKSLAVDNLSDSSR